MAAEPLLEVQGLRVQYLGATAVEDADVRVPPGGVVAVLGPNGAGKTSLLNAVMGLVRPAAGTVRFAGDAIAGQPAWRIARAGIGYVPEGRRVFGDLTVLENLRAGGYARDADGDVIERLMQTFPILASRAGQLAWSLSGGEQQMLAIARALMGSPRLLLLDEPSMGLAPLIVDQLYDLLASLRETGLALLLVEQRVEHALGMADHVHLLRQGRIEAGGTPAQMREHPVIVGGYL